MYDVVRLPSGVQCVTAPMPQAQSISIGIWVKVGARYEGPRQSGVSHFLEHMLFKGTKKRNYREIKGTIEGLGGSMNGFTSEEFTCYLVKIIAKQAALGLDVLCDMVHHALLKAIDVERERQVIIEEIRMYNDQPAQQVHDLFNELLWPRHPLGRPIAGTPEAMRGLRRPAVVRHRDTYYTAPNLVVSVAGACDTEALLRQLREVFPGRATPRQFRFEPFAPSRRGAPARFLEKQTEQTHLCLGTYALPREHPDRYALDVLNVIMGANMSSRLFNEVREERGLAYEISTHVRRFHDTGAFVVTAGSEPQKANQTVQVVVRELGRIRRDLASQDELSRAKEYYTGQMVMALEETMDHMLWIGEQVAAGRRPVTPTEVLEGIQRVTREDVRRVAQQMLRPHRLHVAVVGPLKEPEQRRIARHLRPG